MRLSLEGKSRFTGGRYGIPSHDQTKFSATIARGLTTPTREEKKPAGYRPKPKDKN